MEDRAVWMKVDTRAHEDVGIRRLERALGVSLHEAFFLAYRVWGYLHEQDGRLMAPDELDLVLGREGLTAALIASGLAAEEPGGVRVLNGHVQAWVEFKALQKTKSDAARRKRGDKDMPAGDPRVSHGSPAGDPAYSYSYSYSESSSHSPDPDPEKTKKPVGTSSPREGLPLGSLKQVTDAFQARYLERTGAKPTWNATTTSMLTPLIRQHGADEVCRRIGVLFDAPPKFLSGQVPDIRTLVGNFDKLALHVKRAYSPDELARLAQEQLELERKTGGGR